MKYRWDGRSLLQRNVYLCLPLECNVASLSWIKTKNREHIATRKQTCLYTCHLKAIYSPWWFLWLSRDFCTALGESSGWFPVIHFEAADLLSSVAMPAPLIPAQPPPAQSRRTSRRSGQPKSRASRRLRFLKGMFASLSFLSVGKSSEKRTRV